MNRFEYSKNVSYYLKFIKYNKIIYILHPSIKILDEESIGALLIIELKIEKDIFFCFRPGIQN